MKYLTYIAKYADRAEAQARSGVKTIKIMSIGSWALRHIMKLRKHQIGMFKSCCSLVGVGIVRINHNKRIFRISNDCDYIIEF